MNIWIILGILLVIVILGVVWYRGKQKSKDKIVAETQHGAVYEKPDGTQYMSAPVALIGNQPQASPAPSSPRILTSRPGAELRLSTA